MLGIHSFRRRLLLSAASPPKPQQPRTGGSTARESLSATIFFTSIGSPARPRPRAPFLLGDSAGHQEGAPHAPAAARAIGRANAAGRATSGQSGELVAIREQRQ